MKFQKVGLEMRDAIRTALAVSGRKNCEESFANLYTWGNDFGFEIAFIGQSFILRYEDTYSLPIGPDREDVMPQAKQLYGQGRFTLFGLEAEDFKFLERHFKHIRGYYDRRWSDYVYEAKKLQELTGKKLAAKRNHINAFEREHPNWHTEPITRENIAAVLQFHTLWCSQKDMDDGLQEEMDMTDGMLWSFFELGLDGLVLYAGQDIVAYSLGEPITDETYCVHVEKALSDVRGAYPLINREFARTYCKDYVYINREDDSGEKGLRKAKLSYEPLMIVHKYHAEMEI